MLRIRDVYPGSQIRIIPSQIPDPRSRVIKISGSWVRIRIKEFNHFEPKKLFLSSRKYDPGCSSRMPDPDLDIFTHPGSGIRGSERHLIQDSKQICIHWSCFLMIWFSFENFKAVFWNSFPSSFDSTQWECYCAVTQRKLPLKRHKMELYFTFSNYHLKIVSLPCQTWIHFFLLAELTTRNEILMLIAASR